MNTILYLEMDTYFSSVFMASMIYTPLLLIEKVMRNITLKKTGTI